MNFGLMNLRGGTIACGEGGRPTTMEAFDLLRSEDVEANEIIFDDSCSPWAQVNLLESKINLHRDKLNELKVKKTENRGDLDMKFEYVDFRLYVARLQDHRNQLCAQYGLPCDPA